MGEREDCDEGLGGGRRDDRGGCVRAAERFLSILGRRLFREDAPANNLWLIHSGVVAEDIRSVELDAVRVRSMMAEDPEFGRELTARLLDTVAERVQAARYRLVELYAYPQATP